MTLSCQTRVLLLTVGVLALAGGFLLVQPAIPQPVEYHNFADQRPLLCIPHMLNVVSNLPFLLVGIAGLLFMASDRSRRPGIFLERVERGPYWVFFFGLSLTALGSAYYHADPTNARLVWDRLPLTVTFMALFTAVLAERVGWRLAGWLLGPLVVIGMSSVLYWDWTESLGAGDLRPYLLVQFLPLIVLPVLLLVFPARYTGTADLIASLTSYGIAKVLELLDGQIYTAVGIVSGHTMKHLVAGLGAAFILHMVWCRRPVERKQGATTTIQPTLAQ
jgi:hypothetical protein